MTESKSTTVLLDAGGVILDETEDEKALVAAATDAVRAVNPGYSEVDCLRDLEEGVNLFAHRVSAYVVWKNVRPDRQVFDRCYEELMQKWRGARPALRLMPGLEVELRAMAEHLDIGIAGQYGRNVLEVLEQHDLLCLFKYRFTQEDFDITKPDPRYLERIAAACGVDVDECVMVGDRVDNDIFPAKLLGMKAILIRVGLHRNQQPRTPFEMPDEELEGIAGLGEAVLRVSGAA
jgi:FMN phosphatase YigB (HAD superfamily)